MLTILEALGLGILILICFICFVLLFFCAVTLLINICKTTNKEVRKSGRNK